MKELLEWTKHLAEQAGDLTLRYFQTELAVEAKADQSPVTIADKSAEEFLRHEIEARFPDDGIVGEEFGVKEGRSGRRWIVDPIDGTKSFIRGVPLYGTMIAVEVEGISRVGVIRFPPLGITLSAASGLGCHANGARCQVSTTSTLAQASVMVTALNDMVKYLGEASLLRLLQRSSMQRTWGDCYGYLLVAGGHADAIIDPIMQIWDVAPLIPIIQEAGGTITNTLGETDHLSHVVASNGIVHEEILEIFRKE